MRTITEPSRVIPVVADVEVIVLGGGPAGIAAATAAARTGAEVMLVERYGSLGGMAAGGLVLYMDGLYDDTGERCIEGICWELMERLRSIGGLAEIGAQNPSVDSELFKVVSDDICTESSVAMRLHSWAVDVIRDENRIAGVILESKSGRQAVLGKVCIDATGDGDIAAFAGSQFSTHRMRIGLNYKIGGVDRGRFQVWAKDNPGPLADLRNSVKEKGSWPIVLGETPHSEIGDFWVNVLGPAKRGTDSGDSPGGEIFDGQLDALDVDDLTYAEVNLRRSMMVAIDQYRKFAPGFEHVRLLAIASQLGVRDSRHIRGLHVLTRADVESGEPLADAVGMTGTTFRDGNHLQVPYSTLVPQKIDGLLCAGRCVGVDSELIHAIRIIAPCLMTGQAAGTAAALCVGAGTLPRNLDVKMLQKQLSDDGVRLPTLPVPA